MKIILLALVICLSGVALAEGIPVPSSCAIKYKDGGAPAILQSRKCRHWALSDKFSADQTGVDCHWVTGTPRSFLKKKIISPEEDHVICDLNMEIPFYGQNKSEDTRFGMVAVFDQYEEHDNISKMAPKFIKELFLVHTHFIWNEMNTSDHRYWEAPGEKVEPVPQNTEAERFNRVLSEELDQTKLKIILREALVRTVGDLSSTFSRGFGPNNLVLGCPNIVILVKGQILVVNACSSRPFLCTGVLWRSKRGGDEEHKEDPGTSIPVKENQEFPNLCTPRFDNRIVPLQANSTSSRMTRYGEVGTASVTEWNPLVAEVDQFLVMSSSCVADWVALMGRAACKFPRYYCLEREFFSEVMQCSYSPPYSDCLWGMQLLTSNPSGAALLVPLQSAGFVSANTDPSRRSSFLLPLW